MMTAKELDDFGTSLGWNEIDKIYKLAGIPKCWMDYSYPEPTDSEHSWDQDRYYAEFDSWWVGLCPAEQEYYLSKI